MDQEQKRKHRIKAGVRAKVEWPFRVLKRTFGFVKVRHRGLKNIPSGSARALPR